MRPRLFQLYSGSILLIRAGKQLLSVHPGGRVGVSDTGTVPKSGE